MARVRYGTVLTYEDREPPDSPVLSSMGRLALQFRPTRFTAPSCTGNSLAPQYSTVQETVRETEPVGRHNPRQMLAVHDGALPPSALLI
jgi:hypothetical protein